MLHYKKRLFVIYLHIWNLTYVYWFTNDLSLKITVKTAINNLASNLNNFFTTDCTDWNLATRVFLNIFPNALPFTRIQNTGPLSFSLWSWSSTVQSKKIDNTVCAPVLCMYGIIRKCFCPQFCKFAPKQPWVYALLRVGFSGTMLSKGSPYVPK